jgi:hypothetical protein
MYCDKGGIMMKKLIVILLAFCLMLPSAVAFAEVEDDNDGAGMIVDTLVFRPLGAASLVIGSTAFVLSLPFAFLTGSVDKTYNELIKEPFDHTFVRSVGNIDYKTRE